MHGGAQNMSYLDQMNAQYAATIEKQPQPIKNPSLIRRALPWVIDLILAVAMIAATLLFLQNDNPKKSLFGYRYYFVQSGSMEPELPMGSFILVKMSDPKDIHVGDNVSFYFQGTGSLEPEFWTHKVIEVINDTGSPKFQTQGVANPSPDPFVLEGENVMGKVVYCNKFLGPALMFASKNPLPLLAVIGALFIFVYAIGAYRRRRRERYNEEIEKVITSMQKK